MATDLFDPAKIDAAVGDAFGTRMPTRQPAATNQPPAPIRANNPGALMPGGRMAQYGSMEEGLRALDQNLASYGKRGINTIEGVINRWSPGNAPGNTPEGTRNYINHVARVTGLRLDQPIDLSDPLVRHQISAGITQFESGPRAIYERGAPAASAAPAAPTAGRAAPAASTPGQLTVENLMKPEAINAAVSEAFNAPAEPTKTEKATGAVAGKVRSFLRSSAALADTLYSPVPAIAGMVTYAGARAAGQTPEQAGATQARVTGALERPIGKAAGVTETPEYKGEVTQRLMDFIGENVSKGADWISKQTGMAKPEVEYYMNLGMAAPGALRGTRPGAVISREAGYVADAAKAVGGKVVEGVAQVTPGPVRSVVRGTVEAVAPGTTRTPPRAPTLGAPGVVTPGMPTTPMAQPPQPTMGRGSVGAAGVPDATIIRQALTSATPEFQQLYGNMPLDKVNTPVVLRHLEADSLPVPVRLTEGQATGDVVKLSKEQNLRGNQPAFAQRFNEQNAQLVENVPAIRERAAPDVFTTKTIESSEALINAYKTLDDARNVDIRAAYKALEDANGGAFPVDAQAIVRNADALLAKKLKTNFVPPEIAADLRTFREGAPMNFEQFEALRTNLAAEGRKAERAGDGNRAMAVSLIRQALEDVPLKGEAAGLKPLADKARDLASARFTALKKDPAYKAAVDDAVPADKFFDKFVINGVNKNIRTMVDTLGRDSVAHQHMRAGTINWLSDKAGIVEGRGNFSQANFNKGLKKLDDVKNFEAIFDPDSQLQLRTLGNVAAYTQFQPRGSFVNNSNTLVGYLANKAAGGLEQAGNVMGLKTFGYPIGSEARRVIRSARERREAEAALKPGAGSTLQDISRQGRRGESTLSNEPLPLGGGRREPTLD
jgi:hypothetical protein